METPPNFILLACILLMLASTGLSQSAKSTYYLGFLSPFPVPDGDRFIPHQLSQQWQSAFHVAVEVLNSENRSYQLEPVLQDTACDWMKVLGLSHVLSREDLIGVVGPACSDAALSATQYFDQGIPIVSFSATHERLSNRKNFPNFFRTVYGDMHQASAILTVMEKLNIRNATIICAKDYYSLSLASNIQEVAAERIASLKILDAGNNSTVNASQIVGTLNNLDPNDMVILAVPPLVAGEIWKFAGQVGRESSPWWYFGTDGVTAYEPYTDGSSPEVVRSIQGEIGLAPYDGGFLTKPECQKFYDHWREKAYPGLPASGFNESRSYVTHVIDTVSLYFHVVDILVSNNMTVNASTVLSVLQGSRIETPSFTGCTGIVQIDPSTGSRKFTPEQPAIYDLVALTSNSWELKGRIFDTTYVSLGSIIRPKSSVTINRLSSGGLVAGFVLFLVGLVFLGSILIFYYKSKRNRHINFERIPS